MASFAKIGLNNKVIAVHSLHNDVLKDANGIEQEVLGIDFLTKLHGWAIWKKTSYNTFGGAHTLGDTPFRKNFAGIGFTYDEDRDAFISPKPYASWILNEETCLWDPPVVKPDLTQEQIDNESYYSWNEKTTTWDLNE